MSTPPTIDGFKTQRVDTSDLQYQADPLFAPDKLALWEHVPESHDGWVRAHNAIRHEIAEMKKVVESAAIARQAGGLVAWQVDAIKAWWVGHEKHIHEHHKNEDDIMNPFLRTRVAYPDKLEADHVELVALLDEIAAHVKSLAPGATLAHLHGLWLQYETLMLPHLYEEEMVGLPLCRAYFTPAEVGAVVAQFMKNGDPVAMGGFVHVLGSKKDAQLFMSEHGVPGFVWHIPAKGFKALRILYRKRMQSHIDSLLAGEPVLSLTKKAAKANAAKIHANAQMMSKHDEASDENAVAQAPSPTKRVNVTVLQAH